MKATTSLSSCALWCRVTQIKTYSWDNAQVILVGNKCDMEDERVISFERGKQLAEQLGIEFFETSAKENIHVKVVYRNVSIKLVVLTIISIQIVNMRWFLSITVSHNIDWTEFAISNWLGQ